MKKIDFCSNTYLLSYYSIFALLVAAVGVMQPVLMWDMIGYVASAKHYEITGAVELHQFVFSGLKEFVDAEKYLELTANDYQYRIDMATNSELFIQQLPFYEIRVIYNFSVLLLSKIGVNIFAATYVSSTISTVVGIFLLLFALKDKLYTVFLYVLPIFLLSFGVISLARANTPDSMVFMCICAFIYFFNKEKIVSLLCILPFFVMVRTDLIIFNFLVLSMIFISYKKYRIWSLVSLLSTVGIYLFINAAFNNYGWSTIFAFTLVERVSNPADVLYVVSLKDYIGAFSKGLIMMVDDNVFLVSVGILTTTLVLMTQYATSYFNNKQIWAYVIIAVLYIGSHFVLFPVTWIRFFGGFYTMVLVALLMLLTKIIMATKEKAKGI